VYPELVLFKYGIDARFSRPVVRECRGLILDSRDWSIVARPYDKFFNLREELAADIDWETARVYEKLDGSLCSLYYYGGEWRVATTGNPDASGPLHDGTGSFQELFWKTWNDLGYSLPHIDPYHEMANWTFLFELMTSENRVVIDHGSPRIVLHGARHKNGSELDVAIAGYSYKYLYGWEVVPEFSGDITSGDDAQRITHDMDGRVSEGFVICDADFNRIKIKAPSYVRLHHMRGRASSLRHILEAVLAGEADEIVAYFPYVADTVATYQGKLTALSDEIESVISSGPELSAKEFSLSIKARSDAVRAGAFAIRGGRVSSFSEWVQTVHIKSLMRWLDT
jgi:hypothetical protein